MKAWNKIKTKLIQILKSNILYIRHHPTQKKFARLIENQTIRFGASRENDLILLGPRVKDFEGCIARKKKNVIFQDADGKPRAPYKGKYWAGEYSFSIYRTWHGLLLAFFILLMSLSVVFGKSAPVLKEAAQQAYDLPARSTYGNLIDQVTTIDQLHFVFDVKKPQSFVLLYTPGNIQKKDDLQILVNDQAVGFVQSCNDHWNREQRLYVDPSLLYKGQNKVSFVYHGSLKKRWGLRNLYIQGSSRQSAFNPHKAFGMAQKLYIERNAKSGNLLRSKKMMEKIAQYQNDQSLTLSAKQEEFFTQIKKELETRQGRILRDARILIRNGNYQTAAYYYQRLLKEFIDPMDPIRYEIMDEMREVGVI